MPVTASATPALLKKVQYDKLREKRSEAPVFAARVMDEETTAYLKDVQTKWVAKATECPDTVFTEIALMVDMDATAASVVRLHTHKMPPFAPGKDERNLREATLAGAMMVALPVSVDGVIHHKEGLAFIKISNKVVQVYEDTGKGLKSTLYVKGLKKE